MKMQRRFLVGVAFLGSLACFYLLIHFEQLEIGSTKAPVRAQYLQLYENVPSEDSAGTKQFSSNIKTTKTLESKAQEPNASSMRCQMDTCFKYKPCPVFTNLSFEIYKRRSTSSVAVDELYAALLRSEALIMLETGDPCIGILVLKKCGNSRFQEHILEIHRNFSETNLVVWMDFDNTSFSSCFEKYHLIAQTNSYVMNRSIIVSPFVSKKNFQDEYDIVSGFVGNWTGEVFSIATSRRRFLVYFDDTCRIHRDAMVVLFKETLENKRGFQFPCTMYKDTSNYTNVCPDTSLENLIFTVLSLPEDTMILSTLELQRKLFIILKHGSIPVVVGLRFRLPFPELIDWTKILIKIPHQRMLDLPKILQSYSETVQEAMRINGRLAFNEHFSSMDKTVKAVLSTISSRLNVPGIYFVPQYVEASTTEVKVETSNRTQLIISKQAKQNDSSTWYAPEAHPKCSTPNLWAHSFNNIEAELNSSTILPVSLHHEKFTIVIMTYNRLKELMRSLNYFNGLSRLDKVVIVWNSPDPPNQHLGWPTNMSVPIHVIQTNKNSLNNRFFPYDAIRTDAILNFDDDLFVSHENILFGFRTWQENRNRLVGYPNRAVTMNPRENRWDYVTKYCSSISLILTGCTFLHKMYHVMYTFHMNKVIRELVDKNMNCEDIAMNFLIGHHTQRPPIKATALEELNCPECGTANNSLWTRPSHYTQRTSCIADLSKIYGYLPLFNTEYFAGDIFHGKEECHRSRN